VLSFLHVAACLIIGIKFLTGQYRIITDPSIVSVYSMYCEVLNFVTYTFVSVGFGSSYPQDDLGRLLTVVLMVSGLLLFSYFVAKLQLSTEVNINYAEYVERRNELFETWLATLERASGGGNGGGQGLFRLLKEHFFYFYKYDINDIFGIRYFEQIGDKVQSAVSEEPLNRVVKQFSTFFKTVDERLWQDIFLCLKFRT
jgi:hypothetical protein